MKYTQSTGSSINTKFRSSKRTKGIDGADVVLGPDIVIACTNTGRTIQDFKMLKFSGFVDLILIIVLLF